jgi:outer membrane scaffolding protein for murein synthesis (MipA/OmpV family)
MRYAICAALVACGATGPAFAQRAPAPSPSPDQVQSRDTLTIGIGAAIIPDYDGSNDYHVIPGAAIRAKVHGISITTNGPYIYVDLVPKRGEVSFDGGPIAGLRFDSRHGSDDPFVSLLPRRKTAIEIGGFAGVSFRGLMDPYDSLALHVDVIHDVGKAHESTIISPNVSYSTPLSHKTYVSMSAAADFVGNRYADYYFGVTPEDSLLTGGVLPVFNPSGGLKDGRASLLINQSLTGDLLGGLSIFGLGQVSRLVGDFKETPIVDQRGSASQWAGAIGLAYTW